MHIFLARGSEFIGNSSAAFNQVIGDAQKVLYTYAYPTATRAMAFRAQVGLPQRVIIDSGAFTAFTTGQEITPEAYLDWGLALRHKWESHVTWLRFMNLDVIGNQDMSWLNQTKLEVGGLNPIPIITANAEDRHLERALADYPLFALGGLVPLSKPALMSWLDRCFARVVEHANKTSRFPKVHVLGITRQWACYRYPMYSCDSSTWAGPLRFGTPVGLDGVDVLPQPKEGETACQLAAFSLRRAIEQYAELENKVSAVWARRGVVFDD